jgi:tRNA threonylcarbamoyladenosine biosynthesis protein TsaE
MWRELHWTDENATEAFAIQLAKAPALGHALITLHGDLGAGKTSLVRHLLRALGVQGRIKSPTYALAETYELPNLNAWHFDFYRFSDPREWEDAGLRDIFGAPGLKLAEWPEKAAPWLPPADLEVHLQVQSDDSRKVRLRASSATGLQLLAQTA